MDKKIKIKPEEVLEEVSKIIKPLVKRVESLEVKRATPVSQTPRKLLNKEFVMKGSVDYCTPVDKVNGEIMMQEIIKFMQERHIAGINVNLTKIF